MNNYVHGPSPYSLEIDNILKVKIQKPLTDENVQWYSNKYLLGGFMKEGGRLKTAQAHGLRAYETSGTGAILPIKAGGGKTLTGLLCAQHAWEEHNIERIAYIVEPDLARQLWQNIAFWRRRSRITYDAWMVYKKNANQRKKILAAKRRGLYIISYPQISSTDGEEFLTGMDFGLYVFDEVQNILSTKSARARRTKKSVLHGNSEDPHVIAMSGTLSKKSLMEIHWLVRAAMKKNSYLPESWNLCSIWDSCVNAASTKHGKQYCDPKDWTWFRKLYRWVQLNREHFSEEEQEHIDNLEEKEIATCRKIIALRASTCPGYYASKAGKDEGEANLIIDIKPAQPTEGYETLMEHFATLERKMVAPNGDALNHPFTAHKWKCELSAGFYNDTYWPTVEELMKAKHWDKETASDILARSKKYFENINEYNKLLRSYFSNRPMTGLDTPFLVGKHFDLVRWHGEKLEGRLEEEYDAWCTYKDSDFDMRIDRWKRAVRICDYKIRDAIKYVKSLKKGRGCLIWCKNIEMAEWTYETFQEEGMEVYYAPSGDGEALRKCGDPDLDGKGDKIFICGMGHNVGKNLQSFEHMYVLQMPKAAEDLEQLLARTHRIGQKADEVCPRFSLTTEFDSLQYASFLNNALYYQQTHMTPMRIVYADYIEKPKVFPANVLKERGIEDVSEVNVEELKAIG